MSELISSGGWCAPVLLDEVVTFDLEEYRRRWPIGGQCSDCAGSGVLHYGPACPCPLCERDVYTETCTGCGGTGIEQEDPALAELDGTSHRMRDVIDEALKLPEVGVQRGGIIWPIA